MVSLNDFPLQKIIQFLRVLNNRARMRGGEVAGEHSAFVEVEEARLVWAASKWLEIITEINASKDGLKFSPAECLATFNDKIIEMKSQPPNEKVINLERLEIRRFMAAEVYLDRYAMAKESDEKPKRKYGGKKR